MSSIRAEKKEIGREDKRSNSEKTAETEKQVQTEQPVVTYEQIQKENIQAYTSAVACPQRLQKAKREEQFLNSWKYSRRYKLISLFQRH